MRVVKVKQPGQPEQELHRSSLENVRSCLMEESFC